MTFCGLKHKLIYTYHQWRMALGRTWTCLLDK